MQDVEPKGDLLHDKPKPTDLPEIRRRTGLGGGEQFLTNLSLEEFLETEGLIRRRPLQWEEENWGIFEVVREGLKTIELEALKLVHQKPDSPEVAGLREFLVGVTNEDVIPLLPKELQEQIRRLVERDNIVPESLRFSFFPVDEKGNPVEGIALYGRRKPQQPQQLNTEEPKNS